MRIHVYSLCWNEARMLPYYLRHYQPIAERFFIYDDGSTDGSVELLQSYANVVVRPFENEGDSFVLNSWKLMNHVWKESRGTADWVILCNIDEHLYHPNLLAYLQRCHSKGVTAVPAQGYQMISDIFPSPEGQLSELVTHGMPFEQMNKLLIFNPNAIQDINYSVGRHKAAPVGHLVCPKKLEVKLLHYKFLGLDYLLERHAELKTGLKAKDIKKRWGNQYLWDRQTTEDVFNHVKDNAVPVVFQSTTLCP